jgi:nucleoside-diphosphate-sugar epimerase
MNSLGIKKVLVTGASGKIGRRLLPALLDAGYAVRAVRNRTAVEAPRAEVVTGSVSDAAFVAEAVRGVDAVVHLATTKEDLSFLDVSIRGTFNLLEAAKAAAVKQFILAGGDAALGIYFYPNPEPLTERSPLRAYPGWYALSKVMEEVMLGQYGVQYGLPWTVLRFSWIMDDDDLLRHMTLKGPGFGVPVWKELARSAEQRRFFEEGRDAVACLRHPGGASYVRHVVGTGDVTGSMLAALGNPKALGEVFNVAAPEPFSYEDLSRHIARRLKLPALDFEQDGFHDFSISVSKIREVLGYSPEWDAARIADAAIEFRRSGGKRREAGYRG